MCQTAVLFLCYFRYARVCVCVCVTLGYFNHQTINKTAQNDAQFSMWKSCAEIKQYRQVKKKKRVNFVGYGFGAVQWNEYYTLHS